MKRFSKNLILSFVTALALAPQVVVAMDEFKEEEKEREVKEPGTSFIERLPQDIIRDTLAKHLTPEELIKLSNTSKTMQENIDEKTIIMNSMRNIPDLQKTIAFVAAIDYKLFNVVASMLNNEQFMYSRDKYHTSVCVQQALIGAAKAGRLNIVQLIFNKPQLLQFIDSWSAGIAMSNAINSGHTNIVHLMLNTRNFNNRFEVGGPLCCATDKGNPEIVHSILNNQPFMDNLDYYGARDSLIGAHINVVQLLLDDQQFMQRIEDNEDSVLRSGYRYLPAILVTLLKPAYRNRHATVNYLINNQTFISKINDFKYISSALRALYFDDRFAALKVIYSYLKSWPILKKFVLPTLGKNALISFGISLAGLCLLRLGIRTPLFQLIKRFAPWTTLIGSMAKTFYDLNKWENYYYEARY